jgi:hypothetical protein
MTDRRRGERGVALLLVLWVFMVLGVIALDFARYMRDDAMAAINLAEETRGYYVALAGMNRALYDHLERSAASPGAAGGAATAHAGAEPGIGADDVPLVPADGQWHEGEFHGRRWAVRITDQQGRIALNGVRDPVRLGHIVTNLVVGGNRTQGIDRRTQQQIDTVVASILDCGQDDRSTGRRRASSAWAPPVPLQRLTSTVDERVVNETHPYMKEG